MCTKEYLNRIKYLRKPQKDLNTLKILHERHVFNIPFENLDVQHKIEIRLEKSHLFKKVIENYRGGFCYELNYLFWFLLTDLGFDAYIISAQIFDGEKIGPEYDHMALIINLNGKNWLADVGFGDLFVKPLNIEVGEEQFDGRNYFVIKNWDKKTFLLSMSKNRIDYEKKYLFKIDKKEVEDFSEQCYFKQYSPSSYFVKNKVITLPIENGRKTIFNSKYIVKNNENKTELMIETIKEEKKILKNEFDIQVKTYANKVYKT